MPSIGMPELILILLGAVFFFGAAKLPQLGQSLGAGIKNFKKGMNGEDDIDVTPSKKKKSKGALPPGSEAEEEDEDDAENAAIRPK